ncbi:hypothetical protein MKX03_001771, partial [Papaver bracteatum]
VIPHFPFVLLMSLETKNNSIANLIVGIDCWYVYMFMLYWKLEGMGFPRAVLLEIFFACNKNEEL